MTVALGIFVALCGSLLWCVDSSCLSDLVVPRHVGSYWPGIKGSTRDQTQIPCTARQILYHWTIRKVSRACTLNPFSLKNQEKINEFTIEWRKQTQEAFINICWNGHNSKLFWEFQDYLVSAIPRASENQWWKELKPSPTKVWWKLLFLWDTHVSFGKSGAGTKNSAKNHGLWKGLGGITFGLSWTR